MMRALINHTNNANRFGAVRTEVQDGIWLNLCEWQVLEYLYEHEDNDEHMLRMSSVLGIAQSSFSNATKTLCRYELVNRYHTRFNKKNVILKITDKGKALYEHRVKTYHLDFFAPFFDALHPLTDEQLAIFVHALDVFNRVDQQYDDELIPE